jgi:enamine deaminase RidA (YjgF/YER057c/UK114 family)
LNDSKETDFFEKRETAKAYLDESFENLPLSILSQPAGKGIALEIWTHDTCKNVLYKKCCGLNYTVYEDSFGKTVWGFGLSTSDPDLSFREQATFSFERMQLILSKEGLTMDHLVRQWNYIPEILKTSVENGRTYQNYQLFNDIRQYHYGIYKRNGIYPAATGIGMDTGPVTIDFMAVRPNDSTVTAGLKNPNQTNAYQYGQEVLVGSPLKENEIKKAPLFERAKYIGSAAEGLVFISGTASIAGEQTIGLNDVAEQTNITINNISNLTSEANLKSIGIASKQSSAVPTYLRVYVKNTCPEDRNTIKKICTQRYGDIPILYVKADICRDNLLVEIEGEAEIMTI